MSPVVVQRPGFCRMTDVCCVKHQRQDFHLVDTERKQQSSSSTIQNSKSKAKATKSTADTKINAGLHGEAALQQHDWKMVATSFQSFCWRVASPFNMCFYCRLYSLHQKRKPQQLADKLMTASSLKSHPSVRRQAWQLPTPNQHLLISERADKQGGGNCTGPVDAGPVKAPTGTLLHLEACRTLCWAATPDTHCWSDVSIRWTSLTQVSQGAGLMIFFPNMEKKITFGCLIIDQTILWTEWEIFAAHPEGELRRHFCFVICSSASRAEYWTSVLLWQTCSLRRSFAEA